MITNRLLNKRSDRNRRGSVLVFVVGVLVLLALAATAYLSTARVDRVTTKQNEFNTQVDLLLEACRSIAQSAIMNDKAVSFTASDYFDTTNGATSVWSTAWLASRVPTTFDPIQPWNANNPGGWVGITGPLVGASFEAPTGQIFNYNFTNRPVLVPHGIPYNGLMQPVFTYDINPSAAGFTAATNTDLSLSTNGTMLFAGDADGDGIADSLPVKLPVGKINGVEYYAYFRIIDNGSAVNASTAWSRWFDFDASGTRLDYGIHGFFLTNVGLLEMLSTYTPGSAMNAMGAEFGRMNQWKLNTTVPPTPANIGAPMLDDNTPRPDMNWLTVGDAIHHQLAMRVENPGRVRNNENYRAYQISDSIGLASRFVLPDSLGSRTQLENDLQESLLTGVPTVAYQPNQANTTNGWFDTFFDLPPVNSSLFVPFRPRRALITASSSFRQMTPTIYGTTPSATWPHPLMSWDTPLAAGPTAADAKVSVPKASINTAGFNELFRAFWQVFAEPTASNQPNSGTIFNQANITNYYANPNYTPYQGMSFDSNTHAATGTVNDAHPAGMFRSPIRATSTASAAVNPPYAGTPYMTADQVMILRAALAAKNLLNMRLWNHAPLVNPSSNAPVASPDVLIPQNIDLTANINNTPQTVRVRMYGVHRQPYLTEVFAHNDTSSPGPLPGGANGPNPRGYVAIEFYNPHDIPIDITECRFALLLRHGDTDRLMGTPPKLPHMQLVDATTLAEPINFNATGGFESNLDNNPYTPGRLIIPARGYLVMENYRAAGPDGVSATYRPGSANPIAGSLSGWTTQGTIGAVRAASMPDFNVVYIKNLDAVFNREFILMRPLGAKIENRSVMQNGVTTPDVQTLIYTNTFPTNIPSPSLLNHFAPMDSFDLSGLMINRPPDNEWQTMMQSLHVTAWHYQRKVNVTNPPDTASPNQNPLWEFVYPGRYDGSKSEQPVGMVADPLPRQQGTAYAPFWTPGGTERDPWDLDRGSGWSNPDATLSPRATFTEANPTVRQDKTFTVQVWARDWPGINYLKPSANQFPFGKFARAGDLLQVPFIGPYLIFDPTLPENTDNNSNNDRVLEVNSITMDAAMAEDTDPNDDGPATNDLQSTEQIGRFAPLRPTLVNGVPTEYTDGSAVYNDYGTDSSKWRYRFARRLFDFFSVYAPSNDYMPNVRAEEYGYWTFNSSNNTLSGNTLPTPAAVNNSGTGAANRIDGVNTNDTLENTSPVHGLININTAPVEVLAMLPWIPHGMSPNDARLFTWDTSGPVPQLRLWQSGDPEVDDNQDLARAIVFWRDGNQATNPTVNRIGPFLSVFDLYKVPDFRFAQAALNNGDSNGDSVANDEPDDRTGDLSPYDPTRNTSSDPTTDGIRRDFEEQFMLLNRVSNLITTRSDTFTVYILLQGWRNTGNANPELAVERRTAMIVDRSRYTQTNGQLSVNRVPTN